MNRIVLTIAGTPRARPRPRHGARIVAGKAVSFSYQPSKLVIDKRTGKPTPESLAWSRAAEWYEAVRLALLPHRPPAPWTGPVRCTIDVYFERPSRLLKKKSPDGPVRHTAKPDRDNLDKSILDALTEAGLWEDDAQVCDGPVRKWYAAKGAGPGVIIIAERIAGDIMTLKTQPVPPPVCLTWIGVQRPDGTMYQSPSRSLTQIDTMVFTEGGWPRTRRLPDGSFLREHGGDFVSADFSTFRPEHGLNIFADTWQHDLSGRSGAVLLNLEDNEPLVGSGSQGWKGCEPWFQAAIPPLFERGASTLMIYERFPAAAFYQGVEAIVWSVNWRIGVTAPQYIEWASRRLGVPKVVADRYPGVYTIPILHIDDNMNSVGDALKAIAQLAWICRRRPNLILWATTQFEDSMVAKLRDLAFSWRDHVIAAQMADAAGAVKGVE